MKKIIIFALLCVITQGIWAQTTYKYYECSWNGSQVVRTERTTSGRVDDISTAKYASGGGLIGDDYDYFVATKSCTIRNGLSATGSCKLILCDGVTVTIEPYGGNGGIQVFGGNVLKIYAQSQGSNAGKLIVKVDPDAFRAGIGGEDHKNGGGVEIHGGYVEAHGGLQSAGIGGSEKMSPCRLNIYDGTVKAYGSEKGAGLGGGSKTTGGVYITIYGGDIYAEGGKYAAGIGTGDQSSEGGNLHVYGGKVTAKGGAYGAGIGGGQNSSGLDVTVDGGHVDAYGGTDAAGIGSGEDYGPLFIKSGKLTVNGGYVFADGTGWGAGIGGGEDAKGADVVINGGTVVAWAGADAGKKNGCAIGSEDGDGHRGSLKIGDKMMVHAGQDPGDANGHLFSSGERVPACFFRPYCRVEPCDHQGATYTVSGITSNDTHTLRCSHCLDRSTEKHNFVDGTCTVCGVSTTIYTINIYLPAAVDGGYTDGVYATEPLRQNVVAGTINLPSPNVTHLPNGVEFAGWAVGTPEEVKARLGIDPMSFWIQSGEDVLSPGSSYAVSGNVSLTARYKAVCITLADAADNGETLYTYNDKKTQSVTLTGRTLYKDGSWNTLCLPFNVTISGSPLDGDGVDVRTLSSSSFEKGTLTLHFTEAGAVTKLEAGKPYLIKWSNTGQHLTDLVFSSVTIHSTPVDVTTDYVDFVGIFSPEVIYDEESQTKLYVGADNTLYYPTSEGFAVNSCRAYFQLKEGLVAGEPSTPGSCAFNLDFGDEATGISELRNFGQNAQADAWYTLDGRRLSTKPATSGIYVKNGKKVVIW